MPGPLSRTVTRKRVALAMDGETGWASSGLVASIRAGCVSSFLLLRLDLPFAVGSFCPLRLPVAVASFWQLAALRDRLFRASILIQISGRIPPSSQASRELSTASLT